MKCWAKGTDPCDGIQSGEHYISKNLFSSDRVLVEGFDWLNGETKELPISAIASNILCKKHNELLSDLDSHAGEFWETIEALSRLNQTRKKSPQVISWTPVYKKVNGFLFERWLAKTAINLYCVSNRGGFWAGTHTPAMEPPKGLIDAVFGRCRFERPYGMYCYQVEGETVTIASRVKFESFQNASKEFVGAVLEFKGFRFLIWLSEEFPEFLEKLHYRISRMRFMYGNHKRKLSHQLRLDWFSDTNGPTIYYLN